MVKSQNKSVVSMFYENVSGNASMIHALLLIVAFVTFGWIAVDNLANQSAYRVAMIYVVLLIAAFVIILADYLSPETFKKGKKFFFDAILWDSKSIKKNLVAGLLFFAGWYMFFMRPGFAVAVPQEFASLQAGTTTKAFMQIILGPHSENILFFSALALTFIVVIKWASQDLKKSYLLAAIIFSTILFFKQIPYHTVTIPVAAALVIINAHSKDAIINKAAPVIVAALVIGSNVFPQFHSFAYALVEKNFYAAVYFGFFMVLLAAFIGILSVDIVHVLNNFVALA